MHKLRPASRTRGPWPAVVLAIILTAQAILTVRLIPSAMASPDEARYIYAGHQIINEWLHGGGSPYYETYFSGSPDIYPPLAAAADWAGGLAAVRLMSTVLMLGVTCVMWLTARRLDRRRWRLTAPVACGLFAATGLTHDLGAYANYDSLALLLLALATYCAVRAGARKVDDAEEDTGSPGHSPSRWLLAVPLLLVAANATKYMTVLFDPVVIAAAALCRPPVTSARRGPARVGRGRGCAHRALALALATGTLLLGAAALAGGATVQGVLWSTLARKAGTQAVLAATATPPHTIITESVAWIGIPVALAVLGTTRAMLRWRRLPLVQGRSRIGTQQQGQAGESPRRPALLAVLTLAGVLVTLEALHLGSDESMRQHDDFGVWFACLAAGWTMSSLLDWKTRPATNGEAGANPWSPFSAANPRSAQVRDGVQSNRNERKIGPGRARTTSVACLGALVVIAAGTWGAHYDHMTYEGGIVRHLSVLPYYAEVRPYLNRAGGRYLIDGETDFHLAYLDRAAIPWWDLYDNNYFKWPIPGRGGDSHGEAPGYSCTVVQRGCMYLTGPAAYREAIRTHYFIFISLFNDLYGTPAKDRAIERAVEETPGYERIATNEKQPTWIWAAAYRTTGSLAAARRMTARPVAAHRNHPGHAKLPAAAARRGASPPAAAEGGLVLGQHQAAAPPRRRGLHLPAAGRRHSLAQLAGALAVAMVPSGVFLVAGLAITLISLLLERRRTLTAQVRWAPDGGPGAHVHTHHMP